MVTVKCQRMFYNEAIILKMTLYNNSCMLLVQTPLPHRCHFYGWLGPILTGVLVCRKKSGWQQCKMLFRWRQWFRGEQALSRKTCMCSNFPIIKSTVAITTKFCTWSLSYQVLFVSCPKMCPTNPRWQTSTYSLTCCRMAVLYICFILQGDGLMFQICHVWQ